MNKINKPLKALITGGTKGIGLSISQKFVSEGLHVICTGTKEDGKVAHGCEYIQADFLNRDSMESFLKFLSKNKIDILINNAGINKIDPFIEVKEKDFDDIFKVNIKAPFLISQACLKHMKKSDWGRIVNITSVFSKVSKQYRAAYSTSKFALDGMTAAISAELSSSNILINSVSPGFIETDLTKGILGVSGIEKIKKDIPMKRLGSPEEIASFVCWLASEENTYITGQNLVIDGGFTRV